MHPVARLLGAASRGGVGRCSSELVAQLLLPGGVALPAREGCRPLALHEFAAGFACYFVWTVRAATARCTLRGRWHNRCTLCCYNAVCPAYAEMLPR